jgi:hypothetical protein
MTTTQQAPSTPNRPLTAASPMEARRTLDAHIAEAKAAGLTTDQIGRSLASAGWHPTDVALALQRSDQPPSGSFGYAWLFFGLGFAGLSLAGTFHVMLDGLKEQPSRTALVGWLTILICSAPFAAAAIRWATVAEQRTPALRRSAVRKGLGQTLLWVVGFVGMARLIEFVARFLSALLGTTPQANSGVALMQVLVTIAIAGGLFWWTWDFVRDTADA